MGARLFDGFEPIAPASLTGKIGTLGFQIGDQRFSIPIHLLISTPSSVATALLDNDHAAVGRAIQDIKASTTNINAFNTVFHMLMYGRLSVVWATKKSDQSTGPVNKLATAIDKDPKAVNLDFDIMFDSIKLAVNIKAPTVRDPLCSEFTDEFRYDALTISQIQKLFESGLEVFHRFILIWIFGFPRSDDRHNHCMRVVEKALQLEGFAQFMQLKLELLQDKIDANIAFHPDVVFTMEHIEGLMKKREPGRGKDRRVNEKKKATKKAAEDEIWPESIRTRPHQEVDGASAVQKNALAFSSVKTLFSTGSTPVAVVSAVAPTQEEGDTVPLRDSSAPEAGAAAGQKGPGKIILKFNKAQLAKSAQAPVSTTAIEEGGPAASQPTQAANPSMAQTPAQTPAPTPARASYQIKKGEKSLPGQQLYAPESPEDAVARKPMAKPKPKSKAPAATAPTRVWAEGKRRERKAPDKYEE